LKNWIPRPRRRLPGENHAQRPYHINASTIGKIPCCLGVGGYLPDEW